MIQIKKAVRQRVWLKIATMGPSGAGKTYGSIALAKGLAPNGKVLLVDTENGSASYYADKWDFDVVDMHAPFTSQKYMDVLQEAVRLGYEVIVFDSMSHEWAASGGVLDKKADFDRAKGEKWGNWQDAKKPHALFKEAWLQAPIHVVATMRSKMEYVLETNEKGKQVPRKVGLAPIQDGDSEYEFGVTFEIDRDSHLATAAKDRTGLFDGRSFTLGEAIGRELATWLNSGATPSATPAPEPAAQGTAQPVEPVVAAATQPVATGAQAPTPSEPEPKTVGEVFAQMAPPESAPSSPEVNDFVDGMDPRCISDSQYEALGLLIETYGINRDALRSYMFKAGHLLPGANGPSLARTKAEEFAKLRDRLNNHGIADGSETWSARAVRIINATPVTTYQPVPAAS